MFLVWNLVQRLWEQWKIVSFLKWKCYQNCWECWACQGSNSKIRFFIDLGTMIMIAKDKITEDKETKKFDEAWNLPNDESFGKYHEAIWKEFLEHDKQLVWLETSKSFMPPNQWCVMCKWVFEIKCNDKYCITFVASE